MDALELLDKLSTLGVVITLDGTDLLLTPGSQVPLEVVSEVRTHKAELITTVSHRRVPADTGLAPLLQRLRTGQAWLSEHYDSYITGREPEASYVASLVAWDALEKLLRRLYGFTGCVTLDTTCAPAAPIWCAHCIQEG